MKFKEPRIRNKFLIWPRKNRETGEVFWLQRAWVLEIYSIVNIACGPGGGMVLDWVTDNVAKTKEQIQISYEEAIKDFELNGDSDL